MKAPPINVTPSAPMDSNERLFAVLCHVSAFIGVGIILPLIVYLVKNKDGAPSARHAAEVLNFHLSMLIYAVVGGILTFIGIGVLIIFAVGILTLVCGIIGAIKASKDELYRYPVTIRFVS